MSREGEYQTEEKVEQRLLWLREAVSEVAAAVRNEIKQPLTPIAGGAEMILLAGKASAGAQRHAHEIVGLARGLDEYVVGLSEDALAASVAHLDLSGEEAEVKLRLAQELGRKAAGELLARAERIAVEVSGLAALVESETALTGPVKIMQGGLNVLKNLLAKFAGIDRYVLRSDKSLERTVGAMLDIWSSSDAQAK